MRWRSVVLMVPAAAVVLGACAKNGAAPVPTRAAVGPEVPATPPPCSPPPRIDEPEWFPQDIPFPDGSYVSDVLAPVSGIRQVIMAAPGTLDEIVRYIMREWPRQGWKMGIGEREPYEAENVFEKDGGRYGQFRARDACAAGWVVVYFALTDAAAGG